MSGQRAVVCVHSTTILKKKLAKSTYYIVVLVDEVLSKTGPASGQSVTWNFRYEFAAAPTFLIRFRVIKKALITTDVEAGQGVVSMSDVYLNGSLSGVVELHHKGEVVGNLNYEIQLGPPPLNFMSPGVPLLPLVHAPVGDCKKGLAPSAVEVVNRTLGITDIQFLNQVYRTPDGSSEVYNCCLLTTNQLAVVKISHCDSSEKFNSVQKEGLIMCRMSHWNICHCYESLLDNRGGRLDHWLVMEHIDGVNLGVEIQRRGQNRRFWSDAELKQHTCELLDAFAYMQSQSICHADIKPDNLVFNSVGTLKVIDFGLSLVCCDDQLQRTATYRVGGTPNFFSPLQFEAHKAFREGRNPQSIVQHDPYKSDVYSLGLVFLSMATLRYIDGLSDPARRDLQQILTAEIGHVSGGSWLKDLLGAMLVVEERDRADFAMLKKLGYAAIR